MTKGLPLAITCGDPAGVGLEVFLAALKKIGNEIPVVWFGDSRHLPNSMPFTTWSPKTPQTLAPGLNIYQIDFTNPG